MQTTIIRQPARQHQSAIRIAFCSVLVACLLTPLVAQSADPSAQTGEPAKPAQKTPPFPRKGTDLETSVREQHEYMQWMHENNENVSTILVKLKPEIDGSPRKLISRAKAKEIGDVAGVKLVPERLTVPDGWQVLKLPKRMTEKAVNEWICVKLKQHQYVLECTPNGAIFPLSVPTDPLYGQQWSFSAGPGSANIEKAWDITTGAATTVVAVLDSGITTHEDLLASRILPGYDFVFNSVVANDSDPVVPNGTTGARDVNPSDPGDWVTEAESSGAGVFHNCKVTNSSWHGTHIMGTIGAIANNPTGVAGINWAAKLLPVRVLGKCGNPSNGPDDITAALLWAAGVDIGTPAINPNPAKVINMSLTGMGTCPPNVQEAINQATAKGAVVIAAAGNENRSASYWPATCVNVLTVMATNEAGDRWKVSSTAGSNWGAKGVSAPGTDILSTVNPGTTSPVAGSGYQAYTGTSMAAAQVSGIASLMLAVKPSLTPFEIREIIKASAKKFAGGSAIILGSCGSGSCGSGIVNAAEAVKQARAGRPTLAQNSFAASLVSPLPSGQVVGWGRNDFGQLGVNAASVLSPSVVPGLTQIDRVFNGKSTTWSISSTGEAYALGEASLCAPNFELQERCNPQTHPNNYFSMFGGNPLQPGSTSPVRVPLFDNAKQVAVVDSADAFYWVFAVNANNQVLAWGNEYDPINVLGLGATGQDYLVRTIQTPTVIGGLPPIQRVFPHSFYTLALDQSGNVWAWGCGTGDCDGNYSCNVFGSGKPARSPVPMQLSFLSNAVDIKISQSSSTQVVLKADGTIWRWGDYSPAICLETPVQIPIDQVVAVDVFYSSVSAIRSDGSLWTWSWATPTSPPTQLLTGGVLRFAGYSLVQMADGHLLNPYNLVVSSQSPAFARNIFGTGYSGRLNLANTTAGDDSELQVAISSDAPSISTGQNFNYVVSVSNLGTGAAANSVVSVALPTAVQINSVPAGCSVAGQIITCNLGNVAANYATSLSINVKALSVASTTATAYISSDAYDYASANNSAGVDIAIQAPAYADGDIPTLPEWGVILMGSLLMGNVAWVSRRKYRS